MKVNWSAWEQGTDFLIHIKELPVQTVLDYMKGLHVDIQTGACVCESIANIVGRQIEEFRDATEIEYDADQTSGPVVYQMLKMYGAPQKVLSAARGSLRRCRYEFFEDVCYYTETASGASLKWFMIKSTSAGSKWMTNLMDTVGGDVQEQSNWFGHVDFNVRIHILETIVEKNPNAAFTDIAFNIW
jgi:hypothetical protein